jgi:hypothetical protein
MPAEVPVICPVPVTVYIICESFKEWLILFKFLNYIPVIKKSLAWRQKLCHSI